MNFTSMNLRLVLKFKNSFYIVTSTPLTATLRNGKVIAAHMKRRNYRDRLQALTVQNRKRKEVATTAASFSFSPNAALPFCFAMGVRNNIAGLRSRGNVRFVHLSAVLRQNLSFGAAAICKNYTGQCISERTL